LAVDSVTIATTAPPADVASGLVLPFEAGAVSGSQFGLLESLGFF